MNETLRNFILSFADRYYEENLSYPSPTTMQDNWWEAFDFFLWHACYQGRNDGMSEKVYEAAREILSAQFQDGSRDQNYAVFKQQGWSEIRVQLQGKIGKGKVGKGRDIDMVISALEFIDRLPDRNIVAHSIARIQSGHLKDHYLELQAAEAPHGITQVGPKVAAFYLRDLVALFDLAGQVDADSAFSLQPIDTWVRKIARKLDITNMGGDDQVLQQAIVRMCGEYGISALRFNQGAWYIGYHAFDLLLELPGPALELATTLSQAPLLGTQG